jgi:N,N'-diacetyllegionaminate synthase
MKKVLLGEKWIGAGERVFIVAEAGVNHNGSISLAKELIDVAAEAEADAVKFQTFKAETLTTAAAPKAPYQARTTGSDESQMEMLKQLELPASAHRELQSHCLERGIIFLSTPFDEEAVDLLDELEVPAFKISSGDVTNLPLLRYAASKGRPVILSTGMSVLGEVGLAVDTIRSAGCKDLILLQCVSNYPADPADANLRAMKTMEKVFDVPVGYSDHTAGIEVALAAAALGACLIEKHFTLSRKSPGPDHQASLEPDELKALVRGIRRVGVSLGDGQKIPAKSELNVARVARRSLVAAKDISAGSRLARDMIVVKRPGTGLPPSMLDDLLSRTARIDIKAGALFDLEMLA